MMKNCAVGCLTLLTSFALQAQPQASSTPLDTVQSCEKTAYYHIYLSAFVPAT